VPVKDVIAVQPVPPQPWFHKKRYWFLISFLLYWAWCTYRSNVEESKLPPIPPARMSEYQIREAVGSRIHFNESYNPQVVTSFIFPRDIATMKGCSRGDWAVKVGTELVSGVETKRIDPVFCVNDFNGQVRESDDNSALERVAVSVDIIQP
jgi:hypothetical protein